MSNRLTVWIIIIAVLSLITVGLVLQRKNNIQQDYLRKGLTYRSFEPMTNQIPEKRHIIIITTETRKELEVLTKIHNLSLEAYSQRHGYTYLFQTNYVSPKGLTLPVYWWKLQWALDILETTDCDYVVWMDNDVIICHPEVSLEYLIDYAPNASILIGRDYPSFKNDAYCAGVFLIKNNDIGKEFIRDCINEYLGNKDCKDGQGKLALKGAWAGICYEQGMMNRMIETKYLQDTYRIPETFLCNTNLPITDTVILHMYGDKGYARNMFTKFLQKKVDFLPLDPNPNPLRVAIVLTMDLNDHSKTELYKENMSKWTSHGELAIYSVNTYDINKAPLKPILKFLNDTLEDLQHFDLVFKISGEYYIPTFSDVIKYIPGDVDVIIQNKMNEWSQSSDLFGAKPALIENLFKTFIFSLKTFDENLNEFVESKTYKIYRFPRLSISQKLSTSDGSDFL